MIDACHRHTITMGKCAPPSLHDQDKASIWAACGSNDIGGSSSRPHDSLFCIHGKKGAGASSCIRILHIVGLDSASTPRWCVKVTTTLRSRLENPALCMEGLKAGTAVPTIRPIGQVPWRQGLSRSNFPSPCPRLS